MQYIRRAIIVLVSMPLLAIAGDWKPRQQAIWNLASGYAFLTQCAISGHIEMQQTERLGVLYQKTLSNDAYAQWRDVYQKTLHEKRIYSIAKAEWLPYVIDGESCRNGDRIAEMYATRLSSGTFSEISK